MEHYRLAPLIKGVLIAGNGAKKTQDPTIMMLWILMFFFIGIAFYFMMVRPAKKEQADRTKTLANMKKGDKVVTIGGIHGILVDMEDNGNTVILEVAKNVRIKFLRSAISTVQAKSSDTTSEKG